MYTDSHCHLTMSTEGERALAAAREAGVAGFVVPATSLDDAFESVTLAASNPDVWAAVGFHPHEAKRFGESDEATIRRLAEHERVVAIGEVGLDYHYDHSPRDVQREVLEQQIRIARDLDLPLIIHNRESTEDLLAILEKEVVLGARGVIHSFTETADVARRFVDLGFLISFSGIVTFKSAGALREAATAVPLDMLLIETDSPYLAPVPHRGKENEPRFVLHVADVLGSILGRSGDEIGTITAANFESLFSVSLSR